MIISARTGRWRRAAATAGNLWRIARVAWRAPHLARVRMFAGASRAQGAWWPRAWWHAVRYESQYTWGEARWWFRVWQDDILRMKR